LPVDPIERRFAALEEHRLYFGDASFLTFMIFEAFLGRPPSSTSCATGPAW